MIYKIFSLSCLLAGASLNFADEAATQAEAPKPPVKPNTNKLFFYETFDEKDPFESGKWFKSSDPKYAEQTVAVTPAKTPAKGLELDNGLQLSSEMKHYGLGAKFPTPLVLKGKKELVIQYDLKLEDTLACGGAYIKLPRASPGLDLSAFNNDTPYSIMFGPDKCGSSNNKVHFIMQHQNPITKDWEEKHSNSTATVKMDKKTHLYTLVLREDNSYEVFVDKKSQKTGNLLTHMKPSINPPAEIDDPEDFKPVDWEDEEKILDPLASKPDDWDEDAPKKIPDPEAVKPEGWLDDEPKKIPDPNAEKPEDWDDEEDGAWEAPLIKNPKCEKPNPGCGNWNPPMIKNPDYKGKWKAPMIDNPKYKGPWQARKIANKNIFVDNTPASSLAPMAGIVVEVWTTNGGILFDNFAVTHSLDAAFEFADATFGVKEKAEGKKEKKEKKEKNKKDREEKIKSGKAADIAEAKAGEFYDILVDYVTENPWALVSAALVILLSFVLLNQKSTPTVVEAPSKKTAAAEVKPASE